MKKKELERMVFEQASDISHLEGQLKTLEKMVGEPEYLQIPGMPIQKNLIYVKNWNAVIESEASTIKSKGIFARIDAILDHFGLEYVVETQEEKRFVRKKKKK